MKLLVPSLVFLAVTSSADVTNVIDIAALAACGTGSTNGWEMTGIDSYTDKTTNIRLNAAGEHLTSPDFNASIRSVIIDVKSSSQTGRRLKLFPFLNGEYSIEKAQTCEYSDSDDKYVRQSVEFVSDPPVTRFRIALGSEGGNTGWGISSLAVVTASDPRFHSPEDITVSRIRPTAARISWTPNEFAASNLVTIASITTVPETSTILADYEFEKCPQVKDNDNTDKSGDLHDKYPEFSAERINYSSQTSGVLKVSTGSANGRLTHCGFPNYENMAVELTARRYSGDSCSRVSAYYINSEAHTNEIGSVGIGDEFVKGIIPLSGVPDNAAISFGNLDGVKSNRRFLVDRITFLGDYSPATAITNIVRTAVTTSDSYQLSGLSRHTSYLVTVTSIDADGNLTKPSSPVGFTTSASNGSILIIR